MPVNIRQQSLEQRKFVQCVAVFLPEPVKVRNPFRVERVAMVTKVPVEELQHFEFDRPDSAVVDQIDVAQALQFRLKGIAANPFAHRGAIFELVDRFDVEINRVEEITARRAVR